MVFHSQLYIELVKGSPFSVVDGGARENLFEPFKDVDPSLLFILGFDPDPEAPVAPTTRGALIRAALWNRAEALKLHVAREPSTSSLFPPNEVLLRQFDDAFGYPPRQTARVLDVPGVSLGTGTEQPPGLLAV